MVDIAVSVCARESRVPAEWRRHAQSFRRGWVRAWLCETTPKTRLSARRGLCR